MSLFRLNEEKVGVKGPYSNNTEYDQKMDSAFVGAGEESETSKVNIPALLAAKTAGGSPCIHTLRNGINAPSPSVFKIKDNN